MIRPAGSGAHGDDPNATQDAMSNALEAVAPGGTAAALQAVAEGDLEVPWLYQAWSHQS